MTREKRKKFKFQSQQSYIRTQPPSFISVLFMTAFALQQNELRRCDKDHVVTDKGLLFSPSQKE